jgi:uncharacterized alpha-E superfamily protein
MLCRVAEDVFWMSRYVERAIAVGRLIEVTSHLELDAGDLEDDARRRLWARLLGPEAPESLTARGTPDPRDVRHWLAFDNTNPRSLVSCVRRARQAARGVRESISSEMWEQVNALFLSLVDPALATERDENPQGFYKRVREGAQFFQGLAGSTLLHDEVWHFTSLGTFLERADDVARVLDLQSHLLVSDEPDEDPVRWIAVLRSCGSSEAYARYYSLRVEPPLVVEFLLLNPIFPQSVRFSLRAAAEALRQIGALTPGARDIASPAIRSLGLLSAQLDHATVEEVLETGLERYLADVRARIQAVADQVTRVYLRHEPQPPRQVALARAAQIMAAQQQ